MGTENASNRILAKSAILVAAPIIMLSGGFYTKKDSERRLGGSGGLGSTSNWRSLRISNNEFLGSKTLQIFSYETLVGIVAYKQDENVNHVCLLSVWWDQSNTFVTQLNLSKNECSRIKLTRLGQVSAMVSYITDDGHLYWVVALKRGAYSITQKMFKKVEGLVLWKKKTQKNPKIYKKVDSGESRQNEENLELRGGQMTQRNQERALPSSADDLVGSRGKGLRLDYDIDYEIFRFKSPRGAYFKHTFLFYQKRANSTGDYPPHFVLLESKTNTLRSFRTESGLRVKKRLRFNYLTFLPVAKGLEGGNRSKNLKLVSVNWRNDLSNSSIVGVWVAYNETTSGPVDGLNVTLTIEKCRYFKINSNQFLEGREFKIANFSCKDDINTTRGTKETINPNKAPKITPQTPNSQSPPKRLIRPSKSQKQPKKLLRDAQNIQTLGAVGTITNLGRIYYYYQLDSTAGSIRVCLGTSYQLQDYSTQADFEIYCRAESSQKLILAPNEYVSRVEIVNTRSRQVVVRVRNNGKSEGEEGLEGAVGADSGPVNHITWFREVIFRVGEVPFGVGFNTNAYYHSASWGAMYRVPKVISGWKDLRVQVYRKNGLD